MDSSKISFHRLKSVFKNTKVQRTLLVFIFLMSLIYSFSLANKRYSNFEFGKFDLGNMTQIVWNTAHGRFMEVTDQFGTNMPRWGMSHVDPILLIFVPIFAFYSHPMVLVFFQHLLILSAIFPIYGLVRSKTRSSISSLAVVLSYVMYPALGFILVWTEFHGISFIAPIFIWYVWYLNRNDYFVGGMSGEQSLIYWLLIIFMLAGKEEVGVILALYSIFLYFKNKKLAIRTAIVGLVWSLLCFSVIIPAYSGLREGSVQNFLAEVKLNDSDSEFVSGSNFFLYRYSYLGDSYSEIAINALLHPGLIFDKAITKDKIEALNQLFGPLGYVVLLSPIWMVSLPDLAIVLLSKDEIFSISNHRISFTISALFISYIFLLGWVSRRYKNRYVIPFISIFIFVLNVYFSAATQNPIYLSGKSFFTDKILAKVFAQEEMQARRSKVPRNYDTCLKEMVDIINDINPRIYTGPDYLGAHASMREVNALFPSRYKDADLVIADFFETKTFGPFGGASWSYNKESLRSMMDSSEHRHLYSCGKMSAFIKGESLDSAQKINALPDGFRDGDMRRMETPKITISFLPIAIPDSIKRQEPTLAEYIVRKDRGSFLDKATYWIFENKSDDSKKFYFIDHNAISSREGIDQLELGQLSYEKYNFILPNSLLSGRYKLYFGVGDLLQATDIYVKDVEVL